jgi:uncharacterized protein (TIGR02271 family)
MQGTYAHQIEQGAAVYGSDGEKIGSVTAVAQDHFVIEKGFLFTTDIYVPTSAIAGVDEDGIRLNLTKDQVEDSGWSTAPMAEDTEYGTDGYAATDSYVATDATANEVGSDTLERREERLTVDKQTEVAGNVRVGKQVVEEQQSVDVPVTREEVTLERRSVDRPADGSTFSDEEIEVPVYEERVQTGKETRVVEELEVGKTATTGVERVDGTVRREEFDIDTEPADEGSYDTDRVNRGGAA